MNIVSKLEYYFCSWSLIPMEIKTKELKKIIATFFKTFGCRLMSSYDFYRIFRFLLIIYTQNIIVLLIQIENKIFINYNDIS